MKYYRAPHSKKDVVGKREREREKKRGREKRRKNFSLIIFCVALNFTQHQQQQGKKRERFLLLSGFGGLALIKVNESSPLIILIAL